MPEQDRIGASLGQATALTPGLPQWKERVAAAGGSLLDLIMGAVGVGPETKPNLVGQLLSAAVPLGAVKAGASAAKKGIKAYHGSPHDFDKFSLSKIGTGEGAQAYGHGLYFAEQPAVAQEYKKKLTAASEAVIGGRPVSEVRRELLTSARDVNVADEAHAKLRFLDDLEEVDAGKDGLSTPAFDEALRRADPSVQAWAKSLKGQYTVPTGRMYEVSINADPEDFLDWDAPLSQQSEKVRQAVTKAGINAPATDTGNNIYNATARNFADRKGVSPMAREADEFTAAALREQGVPGIKYLDGASRSAGQGSRNYVVFDDSLIDILKKYGLAGAISGGYLQQAALQNSLGKER